MLDILSVLYDVTQLKFVVVESDKLQFAAYLVRM
jgi:hypothetical protein